MNIAIFVLWVLALARLTRLITADRITDFIRLWADRRAHGGDTALTYFLGCPWCVSMWLAWALAWAYFLATDVSWTLYPFVAMASSYLVGALATNIEPDEDIDIVDAPK